MVKLGLLGCGAFGRTHAQSMQAIPGAQFVAYADIDRNAAEQTLQQYGGSYATDDPYVIIADDAIDAVYICTCHDSHAALCIAAAKAGKHIFCEKPLALKIEQCEAIAEAVEKSGVYLMPGFKMRFNPNVREAREYIRNPQVIVGQMMDNRWEDDSWIQDPIAGGANVLSQGCHTVDLLRYFAGSEPTEIWATGGAITHPGHPCIDQCVASIRFANGCVASWIQGDAGSPTMTSKVFIELFGGGRCVQLHNRLSTAVFNDEKSSHQSECEAEIGVTLEDIEFTKAISENRQPELTVYDGLQATRIVLAAEAAIRTGKVQRLSGS